MPGNGSLKNWSSGGERPGITNLVNHDKNRKNPETMKMPANAFGFINWIFLLMESGMVLYLLIHSLHPPAGRKMTWSFCQLILMMGTNLAGGFLDEHTQLVLLNTLFVIAISYDLFTQYQLKSERTKELQNQVMEQLDAFRQSCHQHNLTIRETEIVVLVRLGRRYKEIADLLFISEKTVDSHMQNIYAKMGVRNKVALLNKLEH
jgi:DNA-binding CsgD family transcriptional regulator